MTSQSPSKVPQGPGEQYTAQEYLEAWEAIGHLLKRGESWSGNERNCAFLNMGGASFADVSAGFGLNHLGDSRAVGVTDWDHDGDLDVWQSNRTAPRLRFLRNDLAPQNHHFVQFRLKGGDCNRDAIGARVAIQVEGEDDRKRIRTVRAGEGYLSQSSKWLHFGLPANRPIGKVVVRWPGGEKEAFQGVSLGHRYRLVQGAGKAERWHSPDNGVQLAASEPDLPAPTEKARIIPHARLPMPSVRYRDLEQKRKAVSPDEGQALLVTLWATWCKPCIKELTKLEKRSSAIRDAGIERLPINIDELDAPLEKRISKVEKFFQRHRLQVRGGLASRDLVEQLDVVQRVLLNHQEPMPVPCSFLLDAEGRLTAIYKGPVSAKRLIADVRQMRQSAGHHRDFAVPFSGRWYVNPLPPDLLAIPSRFIELNRAGDAFDYLQRHVGSEPSRSALPDPAQAGDLYVRVGERLAKHGELKDALTALQAALRFDESSLQARLLLAWLNRARSQSEKAVSLYREVLQRDPKNVSGLNALARLLATTPKSSIRKPREALKLAKKAAEETDFSMPEVVDTLAAAYAANGQFGQAIERARQALKLAQENDRSKIAGAIKKRLNLYKKNQPFISGSGSARP